MARIGKIARLPRHIRDQLNRRLDDGEQGARLVAWLNQLDEVHEVLQEDFGSRPITEQNVSDWKQGGFLEWQQHQQTCEWVRALTDEAEHVADEAGVMPLTDRVSSLAALALGHVVRELAPGAASDAAKRTDFLRVLKELGRMRRDDFEAARLRTSLELTHAQRRNARRRAAQAARPWDLSGAGESSPIVPDRT
jgi:hypothetical protein